MQMAMNWVDTGIEQGSGYTWNVAKRAVGLRKTAILIGRYHVKMATSNKRRDGRWQQWMCRDSACQFGVAVWRFGSADALDDSVILQPAR